MKRRIAAKMLSLKQLIQQALGRFDKAIIHCPQILTQNRHLALNVTLDMLLSHLLLSNPSATAVQIGAFDGKADDPLFSFAKRHPIRCFVIEPQGFAFERLKANYADCPLITPINVAIGPHDEKRPLYTIREDTSHPTWAYQLASFDKAVILKHAKHFTSLDSSIVESEVECLSPKSLLRRCNASKVDALIIDTEGHDMKILSAFLNADYWPTMIFLEHWHLERDEFNAGVKRLLEQGYRISYTHKDLLAYRFNEEQH